MIRFRATLSKLLIKFAQIFGSKLLDNNQTILCRAFLWTWRGRLHIIGLPRSAQLRLVPTITKKLTYWHRSISWEQAKAPNFLRLIPSDPSPENNISVCHVIICHLSAQKTTRIFEKWKHTDPDATILIAYGGSKEEFKNFPSSVSAVHIPDESLRTSDHARQRQQYSGVFYNASQWINKHAAEVSHVHIVEFDAIPVASHLGKSLVHSLQDEKADVIGYGLLDISGTTHPHYEYEASNHEFIDFLQKISLREERTRILSMLGCSSIWTRKCFDEVASVIHIPKVYLEIGIPSIAHHLGYRVRPVTPEQEKFVSFEGDQTKNLENFKKAGAWLVHPCKSEWAQDRIV